MKIKYLGHSCFLIEYNDLKILTDPFITHNPLSKIGVLNIKPDIILLTHDHQDHLGDTIDISKNTGSYIITIFDLAQELNKFNVPTLGGNLGGTIEYKGIEFTFVKAEHSSNKGVPVGFIINLGGNIIYFAGDTNVFLDMKIIKDLYKPNIVMLPIDGRFNMGKREAVYALKLLKPEIVIPMHYGTFDVLEKTPNSFIEEVKKENLDVKVIFFEMFEEKEF
jgi:L-ascorbate metabolism protein UlaG (beta-lactamase superfamily)